MAKIPPQGRTTIQVRSMVMPGQWTSGLCDCFDDIENCCLTCWCPCIAFGRVAEIVDRGLTSSGTSGALYGLLCMVTGCECIYSCAYRTKMRAQYDLPEAPCADFCVHCFCESCALCQEYRELRNRGYDMIIGWQGNMERQDVTGVVQPPPVRASMTR